MQQREVLKMCEPALRRFLDNPENYCDVSKMADYVENTDDRELSMLIHAIQCVGSLPIARMFRVSYIMGPERKLYSPEELRGLQ